MKRAAVLIGVSTAHNLPKLQAVWQGVEAMKSWTKTQGFEPELVKIFTDETETVAPYHIKNAIKEIVDRGDISQLIIYFSGHGVNLKYGEYWLLSDAIIDADAAVNIKGSEERARFSVIPHVVFVSDACRTAPQGIQAQGIEGSIIFPNKPVPGPEKAVDQFYATLLGEPALEIADPNDSAAKFHAVYTDALLEALNGLHADIVDRESQNGQGVIRPRPLKKFLAKDLPIRVFEATHGANPRNQQPDARITSDDDAWLSIIPDLETTTSPRSETAPDDIEQTRTTSFPPTLPDDLFDNAFDHGERMRKNFSLPKDTLRAVIADDIPRMNAVLSRGVDPVDNLGTKQAELDVFSAQNERFTRDIRTNASPFGPLHFETGCGFKIRGAEVVVCHGHDADYNIFDNGSLVQTNIVTGNTVSTLLGFDNGYGTLLPAIQDFLTTLTFDGDRLVDVTYEPSEKSDRWFEYQNRVNEIRNLRAVIASSSRLGTFRLKDDEATTLARRMQIAKGIDPSLALYAAHAYRDHGKRAQINEMIEFMLEDLNIILFDLLLLAGQLNDQAIPQDQHSTFPFLPMLSQSWALIPAYEVRSPPGLENISRHVLADSLWTLFDKDGVDLIAQIIDQGGVL